MRKNHLIWGVFAFLLATEIRAQSTSEKETQRLNDLSQKLEGTYQVQLINMRQEVAFPLELLDDIAAKRQKTDTVYYQLQDRIQVLILPEKIIDQPGFKKLSPTIIHKNN